MVDLGNLLASRSFFNNGSIIFGKFQSSELQNLQPHSPYVGCFRGPGKRGAVGNILPSRDTIAKREPTLWPSIFNSYLMMVTYIFNATKETQRRNERS